MSEDRNLPREVIEEILSRLPIKPLVRFKCVSKSWYASISSRKFARKQLARTLSNPLENPFRVLVYWSFESVVFESPLSLEGSSGDDANVDLGDPLSPDDTDPMVFRLVIGSCDGLVAVLYDFDKIILWNPSIKVARELPQLSLSLSPSPLSSNQNATAFYGFGYDSSVDDYKVVKVVRSNATNEMSAYVFSANVGSWRTILGPEKNIIVHNETSESCYLQGVVGVYLHGALHWLADRYNGTEKLGVILRFDLTTETFIDLTTQPNPDRGFECLWVANDRLSVLSYRDLGVDVWVMNEYGNGKSWSKLFSTDESLEYGEYIAPLCFAKNGDVMLVLDGWSTVRYNIENKTEQALKYSHPDMHQCSLYVQSLVSPYATNS